MGLTIYCDGYPCKFAHLLHPDVEEQQLHWRDMCEDFQSLTDHNDSTQPIFKRISARCVYNWTEVNEMFTYSGRNLDPEHVKNAKRIFSHQGGTLSNEVNFQGITD